MDKDKKVSRDELKQKLREKIKGKRGGSDASSSNNISARMKADPTSTMLAMGLDDPDILKNAKNIVRNPHTFLKNAVEKVQSVTEPRMQKNEDEDEEEAPPPL